MARRKLDEVMRPLRVLDKKVRTQGLLRAVRMALGLRAGVVAERLEANRSMLFRLEQSEMEGRINMDSLSRVGEAMRCRSVYGIVPPSGATLEELAGYDVVNRLLKPAQDTIRMSTAGEQEQLKTLSGTRLIELTKRFMQTGS